MFQPLSATGRFIRQHKWWSLAVSLVLLLAGAGVGAYFWAEYHFEEAEEQRQKENYNEARRHIDLCLKVWSRSVEANLLAARIERFAGNYQRAKEYLDECKRLQGEISDEIQLEYVLLRAEQGEVDALRPSLLNCVEQDHPQSLLILETLARVHMRDYRLVQAIEVLEKWVNQDPDCARAWDYHGWVEERLQSKFGAIKDYRKALELEPDRWRTRMRLVGLLIDDGKIKEALRHLELLEPDHGDKPEVGTYRAQAYYFRGQTAEARRQLENVLAKHPKHEPALLLRGNVEFDAKNFAEAERWIRKVLEINPRSTEIYDALERSVSRQPGREDEARALKRKAEDNRRKHLRVEALVNREIPNAPNNPNLTAELGQLFMDIGVEPLAIRWFHATLNKDANHQATHIALYKYWKSKKDNTQADQHFARLTPENQAKLKDLKP